LQTRHGVFQGIGGRVNRILAKSFKIFQNLSSMTPEERQTRIEEYLQKVEFASLDELSELVDASASTVRRDLGILEARGAAQRTHGGARVVNIRSDEFNFLTRDTIHLAEKEAIGRACAHLIKPGQTVIIDAGTTAYHVARHLEAQSLTLVTNSLPVADLFLAVQRTEVVVTGGVIYPRLGVLVGPLAVEAFSKIHADVAVMSAGGITLEGLTNSHGLLIEIQRAMFAAARRVIMCLDHSKFGRQSVSPLSDLQPVDTIVTDAAAPRPMIGSLRARGIEVIVAPANGPSPAPPGAPARP
jgi:DeoR/GlpR family transcriptional regulator of sugar metabolism